MPSPEITIFTSCYNQASYLPQAIESVLRQTYSDFEYLIYDDGSTDNTWDIISSYAEKDKRIIARRFTKQKNVSFPINDSIERMRGNVWTWCPSDDVWAPTLLQEKLAFWRKYPNDVLYSFWENCDENLQKIDFKTPSYTPQEFKDLVWSCSPIGFTGIFIPQSVINKVGPFPDLDCSEDFAWMIKATIDGIDFRCVEKILYKKRVHTNRTTARNSNDLKNISKNIRNNLRKYKPMPKVAFFYWEASKMSFLRYLTLLSFSKFNPEWAIELWQGTSITTDKKPWVDPNEADCFSYTGDDYLDNVYEIPNLSFHTFNTPNKCAPPQASDFFRWHRLNYDGGGLFSDMDILYTKPINYHYLNAHDLCLCFFNDYFTIGLLSSKGDQYFWSQLLETAENLYNDKTRFNGKGGEACYQAAGVTSIYELCKRYEGSLEDINNFQKIKSIFNRSNIGNIPKNWVYQWTHKDLDCIFAENLPVPKQTIGIHWYGGSKQAQDLNSVINHTNYKNFPCTLTSAIDKVLQ